MARRGEWVGWAAGAAVAAVAGAVAYGRFAAPAKLPLPLPVPGEQRQVDGRAGPLTYYVAGSGAPLLLIHSINAAGSAYEVRPIHEAMAAERRVYAVDLPGFGRSDRSDRPYSIGLYADAIRDMLDAVAADGHDGPVDALALSLSSEFLARVAVEEPGRFRSLTLVTPTGFERGSDRRRAAPGQTREVPALYSALRVPLWSRGLFNLLVTRPSIRFFLEKTFGSDQIDEGLFEYDYLTTHQPGAENAPFAFVSGRLFSADICDVYERVGLPTLVMHGTRGDFQDFSESGWAKERPNWRFVSFDTGALPHFEEPALFASRLRAFLGSPGPGHSSSPSPGSRLPSP